MEIVAVKNNFLALANCSKKCVVSEIVTTVLSVVVVCGAIWIFSAASSICAAPSTPAIGTSIWIRRDRTLTFIKVFGLKFRSKISKGSFLLNTGALG